MAIIVSSIMAYNDHYLASIVGSEFAYRQHHRAYCEARSVTEKEVRNKLIKSF